MHFKQAQHFQKGKIAEAKFMKLTGAKPSSKNDDIYKHIDCYLNGKGVDVKSFRKAHSNGYILVEFKNVQGKDGWCSKGSGADYIAFEFEKGFLVVGKEALRVLAQDKIFKYGSATLLRKNNIPAEKGLYNLVGRASSFNGKPRKDEFTYLLLDDVQSLPHKWILY